MVGFEVQYMYAGMSGGGGFTLWVPRYSIYCVPVPSSPGKLGTY